MLRHLKMELKRREEEQQQAFTGIDQQQQKQLGPAQPVAKPTTGKVLTGKSSQRSSLAEGQPAAPKQAAQRRVRGRRSSKPMMEKRRRARINQCLDILKSYVLTDSTNLTQLGIDATTRENHDEETIARNILKSSGLINRHRGRKNPNKLEKADILELTVDYVRRLHQRLVRGDNARPPVCGSSMSSPLTLDLSPIDSNIRQVKHIALKPAGAPPSPPPSSASNSPQPLLSISSNSQHCQVAQTTVNQAIAGLTDVLDLSDCRRKTSEPNSMKYSEPIYKDNMIFIEGTDGCWRPAWNPALVAQGLK